MGSMDRILRLLLFAGAALAAGVAVPHARAQQAVGDQSPTAETDLGVALDPQALGVLKAMSERLAAARTMTFTALATREVFADDGQPLYETTLSYVTLQRPDKLRVITPGDGPAAEFYYDGKRMTLYAPESNSAAVAAVPDSIDAMVDVAWAQGGIYFPFVDMILSDPYQAISDGLEAAADLGPSRVIGGTETDRVAITASNVQAELWIGHDDHLPRLIRAVYPNEQGAPRFDVALSDWRLDGAVSEDAFRSAKAEAAQKVEFTPPARGSSDTP
jgi:hypothetical protein